MESIPKYKFADVMKVSMTTLREYTRIYKEALTALGQRGYSFNYKAALYLCHVLVVDVCDLYPKEDKQKLIVEQQNIIREVNEKLSKQGNN